MSCHGGEHIHQFANLLATHHSDGNQSKSRLNVNNNDKNNKIKKLNCNKINNECNNKNKSTKINELEALITDDLVNSRLTNDIPKKELTVNKDLVEPTPVTLANVKGGKKNREDKHVDLRVLLDSGSSHSIIQKNFAARA